MQVVILDKKVRHNLALFRHLIHRQAKKGDDFFRTARKVYKGYVNCKTGELQFFDLNEKQKFSPKEWKEIVIQLRPNEEGAFEVLSSEEDKSFDCSTLDHEAYALLTKTMHILNQLSFDPKYGKNPFWVLKHVAVLDLVVAEEEEGKKSLIHEAWHNIDRAYAEHLLRDMPVGTYLFRKDEFAQILEDTLNENLSSPVTCITLTYRDWDKKIAEKTLIYKDEKWLFYNDDPTLLNPSFDSVRSLLETLGSQLKKPLLAA